jgi:hypothetical protein
MTVDARIRELNDRAVKALIESHANDTDDPLVLAIRYSAAEDDDIYLLEVLASFPGGDDDDVLMTEFEPSAELRILGRLHLALASPAQLRAAVTRNDPLVAALRRGAIEHEDRSAAADELKTLLGL